MAKNYIVPEGDLEKVADAIREQSGKSELLSFPKEYVEEIENLNVDPELQKKEGIVPTTESQTVTPDDGYYGLSEVQIDPVATATGTVSSNVEIVTNGSVRRIVVTPHYNVSSGGYVGEGDYTGEADTITADQIDFGTILISQNGNQDVTGRATASVNVYPNLSTKTITQNGTYNATSDNVQGYSNVYVNVEGARTANKTITSNGTYNASDDNADGYKKVVVSVPTSGQVGNFVYGTFRKEHESLSSEVVDYTVSYNGNGYPVMIVIVPTEGVYSKIDGGYYNANYVGGVTEYVAIKQNPATVPDYDAKKDINNANVLVIIKSTGTTNSSKANSYASSGACVYGVSGSGSSTTPYNALPAIMKSSNTLSVYFRTSGSSGGFAYNVEYTYYIIYSA